MTMAITNADKAEEDCRKQKRQNKYEKHERLDAVHINEPSRQRLQGRRSKSEAHIQEVTRSTDLRMWFPRRT